MTSVIRTFVINLDRDVDRLDAIRRELLQLGMEFERWPATCAQDIPPGARVFDGVRIQDFGPRAGGEIGCAISHIRLWRHIVASGIDWSLVLEDDARLRFGPPWSDEDWAPPDDADIVLLNGRAAAGRIRSQAGRFGFADVVGGAGTEGYLVSAAGAATLLSIMDPVKDPLDFQMYAHVRSVRMNDPFPHFWSLAANAACPKELVGYRLVPAVVTHADVESTIGGSRHPRAKFYCRLLLDLNFDAKTHHYVRRLTDTPEPGITDMAVVDTAPVDPVERVRGDGEFLQGVDFSHCPPERARATAALLAEHGVNALRVSVFTDDRAPMSLEHAARLAEAATAEGLRTYVVLHYSDTWADPGQQRKPTAWATLPIRALIDRVEEYTESVLTTLQDRGVTPSVIQLGNEITYGMLWAEPGCDERSGGRLLYPAEGTATSWQADDQWIILAEMLKAGVTAVRRRAPSASVAVHYDLGPDVAGARRWMRRAHESGVDFDAIVVSYYSLWHRGAQVSRMSELAELTDELPDRKIIIGETAYPFRPFVATDGVSVQTVDDFALTPQGQRAYLEAALAAAKRLPSGAGLFWWGACFVDDSMEAVRDHFQAHALFTPDMRPLPALAAFRAGKASDGRR